jgi:CHAT domain-containing protein/Flp pilus assembly protein TadD
LSIRQGKKIVTSLQTIPKPPMKKIFLSGLCTLFSVFVFAQTWEELNKQVNELYSKGELDKTIPVVQKAIEAAKKEFGDQHLNYAASIYNLGTIYTSLAQYKSAEPLLIQAKEILEKTTGENNLDYCLMLNNLGVLYERTSQYEKAEPLHLQATEIRKKLLGDNDSVYAQSLNNLAVLYVNMGQYEKGEGLHIKAMEIQKKTIGENHREYANSLNSLAFLYKSMGQYEKAEPLYIRAKEIRKETVGENHPEYGIALNNLGVLYTRMGQYERAEPVLIEAKEIRKKAVGENHPYFATSLNNLAILYERMEQFEKAESLYIQTKEIRKKIIGETHTDYAQILNNLGVFYIRIGKVEKAEPLILAATDIKLQNLGNIFGILSEKEKRNYLSNNINQIEINNSLLYKSGKTSSALSIPNFNLQLFLKLLSLAETRSMLESVNLIKDTTVQNLLKRWLGQKKLLARQYSLPQSRQTVRLDSVEAETEVLEKELTRRSAEFKNQQKTIQLTITDVQSKLNPDEVAVEFVRFRSNTKQKSDSVMYAAYILNKNDSLPVFVPLFEEKQLQPFFNSSGKTATRMISDLYPALETKGKNEGLLGEKLYKLVWQPLEPYLKGVKKISYSPTGRLYTIAFHALSADSKSLLMDKYQLQQYTSTRQVALRNTENQTVKPVNITLFGDANFSMDSLQITKQRTSLYDSYVSRSFYTPPLRSANYDFWHSLPGTAEEVKKIKALFDQNKMVTKSFVQTTASEENLKALSGNSPQILHIATHGFFLPEPEKNKKENGFDQGNVYTLADDPLLRTGLILSGGNYTWSGKEPIEGVEDGIVTAYEIAQLNLSNTELVVLSACETALGDVKGTEGVFGLQRAFKMAGVKKMIVSLWKVPDRETSELMTAFYTYWMKGKTINDAFVQAQDDMRKKYSPFYWAAFVLVE